MDLRWLGYGAFGDGALTWRSWAGDDDWLWAFADWALTYGGAACSSKRERPSEVWYGKRNNWVRISTRVTPERAHIQYASPYRTCTYSHSVEYWKDSHPSKNLFYCMKSHDWKYSSLICYEKKTLLNNWQIDNLKQIGSSWGRVSPRLAPQLTDRTALGLSNVTPHG